MSFESSRFANTTKQIGGVGIHGCLATCFCLHGSIAFSERQKTLQGIRGCSTLDLCQGARSFNVDTLLREEADLTSNADSAKGKAQGSSFVV